MRRIASFLAASVLLVHATTSGAEPVKRMLVKVDALPLVTKPVALKPAEVALPGARHGGRAPRSWTNLGGDDAPASVCLEERTGTVFGYDAQQRETMKIVTIDGKDFLDKATVAIGDGVVRVKKAERTPIAKLADAEAASGVALYGYRHASDVVLVAALDYGIEDHMAGYGCRLQEVTVGSAAQTLNLDSDAAAAQRVMRNMGEWSSGQKDKKGARLWIGADFRVAGSVSRSSADVGPVISLLIQRTPAP